jgi:endo-alpha-1,4-polygalactosaminidase (GH114 family)
MMSRHYYLVSIYLLTVDSLEEYYKQREQAKKELNEKQEMKNRIANLENNMQEIKSLLLELAQRKA